MKADHVNVAVVNLIKSNVGHFLGHLVHFIRIRVLDFREAKMKSRTNTGKSTSVFRLSGSNIFEWEVRFGLVLKQCSVRCIFFKEFTNYDETYIILYSKSIV